MGNRTSTAQSEDLNGHNNTSNTHTSSTGAASGSSSASNRPRVTQRSGSTGHDDTVSASSHSGEDVGGQRQQPPGTIAMIRQGYTDIVNAIIRPPRASYSLEDLGPPKFTYMGRKFTRTDFTLRSQRGKNIVCSHWEPEDSARPREDLPCVVYLHGNSSCRLGSLEAIDCVLREGCTLFAFDFAGSGLSEGEYVTLGEYEKEDVATVIDHLRSTGRTSTIALWGRSMGAATALMHSHRDPSIAAFILDSAFASLRQLANEIVERGKAQSGYNIPGFVINIAIRMVASSVWKKSHLDINALRPMQHVDQAFVPALFCAAEDDDFIQPHHSREIYEAYAGDKNFILVNGGHNGTRPQFFQDSAAIFLRTAMQIPDECPLEGSNSSNYYRRETVRDAWARESNFHFSSGADEQAMIDHVRAASSAVFGIGERRRSMDETALSIDHYHEEQISEPRREQNGNGNVQGGAYATNRSHSAVGAGKNNHSSHRNGTNNAIQEREDIEKDTEPSSTSTRDAERPPPPPHSRDKGT